MERDEKGRFVRRHRVLGKGILRVIDYNAKNGVWNKGMKGKGLYKQPKNSNIIRSETMKKRWKESELLKSSERSNKIKEKRKNQVITEETKQKISLALKEKYKRGEITIPFKGKKMTEEQRKKLSQALKGLAKSDEFKQKVSVTLKELYKSGKRHVIWVPETKPEKIFRGLLEELNISFTPQKKIYGTPDFFIEPNVCIFVDGDYWHSSEKSMKRDEEVDYYLIDSGFKVIRFKEKDILKNINKIKEKIVNEFQIINR